jgi:hypothetical protein
MKRFAAILIAAAASAHAQFAVMHTNGVVTSPSNLTIQQSNVAGLANTLTTKLDTNGSAAGLTGFVGTTNAETARGNLGISNSFAGQFHADFYDDFSRYTNGTQFTNGAAPVIGSNYVLRFGSGTDPIPTITNGVLAATNTSTWYLSSELTRPIYNFGLEWTWETGKNANLAWPVVIIRPDDQWLNKLLHIVVSPQGIFVDVAVTNGASGFVKIAETNFGSSAALQEGIKHILTGEIENNTLRLKLAGKTLEVTDSRISEVSGRFFTYEYFGNYPSTNVANIFWHRAWANSPNMMQWASQPFSQNLAEFSNGDARVARYLTVGTNRTFYNGVLSAAAPVFIDGTASFRGLVRGTAGTNTAVRIGAPMVMEKDYAQANTNTTNLHDLSVMGIPSGSLYEDGSRWKATYIGSFATNTNSKRVAVNMAGIQLDTGDIQDEGEWITEVTVYRSTNNSHEGFAIFQSEQTKKTARWTFNNGEDVTFNVSLRAAATSNNEVTLRGAWADWYP